YKETLEAVGENNQYIYTSDKRFVFIIKDKKREGNWWAEKERKYWWLCIKYDDKEEEDCQIIYELTNEKLGTIMRRYIRIK
ncbi:MAG: hypothetical protein MUC49_19690, partial [Raineya sp.]|nr:hypothetical protein [Raineya sp.]